MYNGICDEYADSYPQYFATNEYVYGSVNNWMIVYKKVFFTKTNEDRPNIFNKEYATYLANKLRVIAIIDKFVHFLVVEEISFNHFNEILKLKVENVIKPTKSKLVFYKSYIVAHFQNIPLEGRTITYTGPYKSYYDNGRLSSEGNYIDSEKSGRWQYYYNIANTEKPDQKSFSEMYDKGNIVRVGFGNAKF